MKNKPNSDPAVGTKVGKCKKIQYQILKITWKDTCADTYKASLAELELNWVENRTRPRAKAELFFSQIHFFNHRGCLSY